jgi:hypothetical protein
VGRSTGQIETSEGAWSDRYRLLRWEDACGVLVIDGEEKHLREFKGDGISTELIQPFRANAGDAEFSRIQVRHYGRKVLEDRWTKAGDFTTVTFEPGEWDRILDEQPPDIPMD